MRSLTRIWPVSVPSWVEFLRHATAFPGIAVLTAKPVLRRQTEDGQHGSMVRGQRSVQDTGKMNFPRITGPGKDEIDFSRGTGCWKGEPILFGFVRFNAALRKQV